MYFKTRWIRVFFFFAKRVEKPRANFWGINNPHFCWHQGSRKRSIFFFAKVVDNADFICHRIVLNLEQNFLAPSQKWSYPPLQHAMMLNFEKKVRRLITQKVNTDFVLVKKKKKKKKKSKKNKAKKKKKKKKKRKKKKAEKERKINLPREYMMFPRCNLVGTLRTRRR